MYVYIRNDFNSLGGEYKEVEITSFRPKKLIRCLDGAVVDGSEAKNGYCTLSYSWNWLGDIEYKNGKSERIDNEEHIIEYKQKNGKILDSNYIKKVCFEDIIQEICNFFKIEYIWFDQICINQGDKYEKQEEIKIMHKIYSNSLYTIALIPEFNLNDTYLYGGLNRMSMNQSISIKVGCIESIKRSEWSKRMWTLEEAMMSKQILFVGRNIYMWSNYKDSFIVSSIKKYMDDLFDRNFKKSANMVLRYSHQRVSTKKHDKIFALINIFHEIININTDYTRDIKDLANDFYSQLIKNDLSIICFGKNSKYKSTIDINLPSWTGVNGTHCTGYIKYEISDIDYSIKEEKLYIKCEYIQIYAKKYKNEDDDLSYPSLSGSITDCIKSEKNKEYYRMLIRLNTGIDITHYIENNGIKLMLSLVEEKCENIYVLYIKLYFNDDIILYPIIKKVDNLFWKIIGVCFSAMFNNPLIDIKELFYDNIQNKQFIII